MAVSRSGAKRGFIRCYGLFWRAEEVLWTPGRGNGTDYRLLGRRGKLLPGLAVCDFREQRGIYVLYDDYGPYYVGLAREQPIGHRLRSHVRDHHRGRWDRFSWFGFRRVLTTWHLDGTQKLGKMPQKLLTPSHWTIGDIETLLIESLGTHHRGNAKQMRFAAAEHWTQIALHEVDHYLDKVAT